MKQVYILFLIVFCQMSFGQVMPQSGGRTSGVGYTGICFNDVWSVYNNPGAFGQLEKTSVGLAVENRFLLKELSTQFFAFGYHTKKSGNIGMHFQQYGFDLYREMNGGLTYGMKLFEHFSAGVSINYHGVYLAENYGKKNTVSASLGLMYDVNKSFSVGFRVINVNRTRLATFNDERFPTYFGVGIMYRISKKASWMLEAEKDLVQPLNIKSGLEIKAHDIVTLRLGVNSNPFITAFGIGLNLKKFYLDAAAQWHSKIGLSPALGLHYTFN